ncbi:hypothetical protein [Microcoleus sp. FACHB-68]|nr:hypothetical protein [Microcoleus sp. FACHB-68]
MATITFFSRLQKNLLVADFFEIAWRVFEGLPRGIWFPLTP